MLFSPQSQYAWDTLKTFFEDPLRRMKDMHIERITLIEPLQGQPLAIPLRFIKSFEVSSSTTAVLGPPCLTFIRQDLHTILYLACKGTRGGRYIEGRRYELDDAITSEAVEEDRFGASLEDGKVFEVTILMPGQLESADFCVCPKCGAAQDERDTSQRGWVRWQVPKAQSCAKLTGITVFIAPPKSFGVSRMSPVPGWKRSRTMTGMCQPLHSCLIVIHKATSNVYGPENRVHQEMTMEDVHRFIFRRMKIEIVREPQKTPQRSATLHPRGYSKGCFSKISGSHPPLPPHPVPLNLPDAAGPPSVVPKPRPKPVNQHFEHPIRGTTWTGTQIQINAGGFRDADLKLATFDKIRVSLRMTTKKKIVNNYRRIRKLPKLQVEFKDLGLL
jgi:hypothetical protein